MSWWISFCFSTVKLISLDQIQLVMQIIKPIIDGKANSFEIKEQVFTEYNKWLQNRLKKSVWAACSSYYHTDRKRGKITAVFPGPVTLFWYVHPTLKKNDNPPVRTGTLRGNLSGENGRELAMNYGVKV